MFTLELASAADVAALRAWFESAGAGARAVYATGALLPREAEGVKLVAGWKAAGLVVTTQRRDPADARRFQFLCEKAGADRTSRAPAPVDAGSGTPSARAVDRGDLSRLLELLRRCAERARPCPSNAELAAALALPRGEKGRQRARYLVRRLADEGRIAVESRGTTAPRVVTILARGRACGKATARGEV